MMFQKDKRCIKRPLEKQTTKQETLSFRNTSVELDIHGLMHAHYLHMPTLILELVCKTVIPFSM